MRSTSLASLERQAAAPVGLYLGLISGTSADGVDAALVLLDERSSGLRVELRAFQTVPYPPSIRQELTRLLRNPGGVERVSRLHVLIGEAFAKAALRVLRQAGVASQEVVAIGSHGQTVWHAPPSSGERPGHSLQLGQPAVIAARLGIPVVADFRAADLAHGGEGAPLIPYFDWKLWSDATERRWVLNLGGIANGTYLPPNADRKTVLAFDTGPGNALLDAAVAQLTQGRERFDFQGRWAARGRVDRELLAEWLKHSYFRRQPPKSTGRELFGEAFVARALEQVGQRGGTPADALATLTALTAHSVADACQRFLGPIDRVVLSGGGVHNPTLCRMLQEAFAERGLQPTWCLSDHFGVPADAKEAIAFALFARETLRGVPVALPQVTGASRAARLGTVALPT